MNTARPAHTKREILRLFAHVDTRRLQAAEAEFLQDIIKTLLTPPALSRELPTQAQYQRALEIVQQAPKKTSLTKVDHDLPIGPEQISLVMQALESVPESSLSAAMRQKMLTVLRSMAKGQAHQWQALAKSTETADIRLYAFLKDALLRAKEADAFRMEQSPIKRSRKRFWDGGVSI